MKFLKRDIRVEALRIVGVFIVIGVHVCLPMSVGKNLDSGRALIAAFFADGVALYWLISGFFMFERFDYKRTLERTMKTIVLPLIVFSVFIFFFGDFILKNDVSFIDSILHSKEEYLEILRSLMIWENPITEHLQLWYLYIYILLMLVSPVVYSFITYIKGDIKRENCFLVISFVFLVINDISNNQLAMFSHHTINALVPAMLLMVWGNILYRRVKDADLTLKHAGVALLVFVLCNVIRWGLQIFRSVNGVSGIHIYFWFTSLALVNVSCLIIAVFALLQNKKRNKRYTRVINGLASYTFMIYLLHMFVYMYLNKLIDFDALYKNMCNWLPVGEGFLSEFLYVVTIIPIVFVLSFGLAIVLREVEKLLWRKRKR